MPLFGSLHLVSLAALALLGAVLLLVSARWMDAKGRRRYEYALALFILLEESCDLGSQYCLHGVPLADLLPLHLCGLAILLVAVLLISHHPGLFQLLFYWGISGAMLSIFTPEEKYPFPDLHFFTYFLSHGLIIIGVLHMVLNHGMRPTLRGMGAAIAVLNLYMLCLFPINLLLGANYLFLMEKPHAATPLDYMGAWPWYILAAEFVGVAVFLLCYCPFWLHDRIFSSAEEAG
jgi:hypothetical integral membrane protein (TIGR02206 family)